MSRMHNRWLTAVASCVVGSAGIRAESTARPWTIVDSIELTYLVRDESEPGNWPSQDGEPVVWSPDRKHAFVVARRGNAARRTMDCELNVFNIANVEAALAAGKTSCEPDHRVLRSSRASRESDAAISRTQWVGNDTIAFMSSTEDGAGALHLLRLGDGELTEVWKPESASNHGATVMISFGIAGGNFILVTSRAEPTEGKLFEMPAVSVTDGRMRELIFPAAESKTDITYGRVDGTARRIFGAKSGTVIDGPYVSPDGHWAVLAAQPEWDSAESPVKARMVYLIDLQTGSCRRLLNAPVSQPFRRAKAMWTPDSRQVVLDSVQHPIGDGKGPSGAAIVAVNIGDGFVQTLASLPPVAAPRDSWSDDLGARWVDADGGVLTVEHYGTRPGQGPRAVLATQIWSYAKGRWEQAGGTISRRTDEIELRVIEGPNEPPRLVASQNGRQVLLTPPDPVLMRAQRVDFSVHHWCEPDGRSVSGLLALPPGDRRKVPLVIQCLRSVPTRFFPDGPTPTAFAAQALVAKGMAVLQIDIPAVDRRDIAGLPAELPAFVNRLESAVSSLLEKYPIDTDKVGLVGFSRGGYMVHYAITHPRRYHYAAALIADSWSGSFESYVLYAAIGMELGQLDNERQYGGPFWNHKQAWLDQVPIFNLDRLFTPVLFSLHGRAALYQSALTTVGAYKVAQKPFEYLFFPRGAHQLQSFDERFASLAATVDWMCFWLMDEAPENPESASRWAILRKQQDEVLKTPPPPKGKWVFEADPVQPEWHPPAEPKKEEPKPVRTGEIGDRLHAIVACHRPN